MLVNGGYLYTNREGLKQIARSDKGVIGALVSACNASANMASARANETYTVDTQKGKFRTYARVSGEEPDTAGYWRGKRTQALWHSKPYYGG